MLLLFVAICEALAILYIKQVPLVIKFNQIKVDTNTSQYKEA